MTALNGVVQAEAVHLFTDGALYRSDGRITAIGSKVQEFPEVRVAVACSGWNALPDIRKGVERANAKTAMEVLHALPAIIRSASEARARENVRFSRIPLLNKLFGGGKPIPPDLSVLVALWDNGPQLWVIFSDRVVCKAIPPYQPVRLTQHFELHPGEEEAVFGAGVTLESLHSFDPAALGIALLDHQRRQPWVSDGVEAYCVGGLAEMTTVTAEGVTRRTLKTWPDKVGQYIDPAKDTEVGHG